MTIKLYSYWRSSASWRIRIVLNVKGISFETVAVNLLKGEQKEEKYLAINPTALVPTLDIDGELFMNSPAIMELLEDLHPDHPLLPKDPLARAKVRGVMSIICCDIHPVQNLRVIRYAGDAHKDTWAKHFITTGFQGLEPVLKKTAGKYCFGDEITLADACLVPQVFNAKRWGVDMTQFPTIAGIDERLAELEAFKKAAPNAQPDAVIE
ncbi:hypothetical protein QVD99_004998 [Batrachochytrium dendrobatidis]|nr:hypothetical protein O5D80_004558 [Batrachochytrium dendrobatidis]KAK5667949.1 hypothetical protein QVD99_004998 [Batrachochytrium dendrobatidis]